MRQAVSTAVGAEGDRPVFPGRSGPAPCSSSRARCPIDPATGQIVDGDIAAQTHRVFQNIGEILKAGGASFDHVVRTTVFLADMNDFAAMNEVYGDLLRVARPCPSNRPGLPPPQGRADRNRRHCVS